MSISADSVLGFTNMCKDCLLLGLSYLFCSFQEVLTCGHCPLTPLSESSTPLNLELLWLLREGGDRSPETCQHIDCLIGTASTQVTGENTIIIRFHNVGFCLFFPLIPLLSCYFLCIKYVKKRGSNLLPDHLTAQLYTDKQTNLSCICFHFPERCRNGRHWK